jgi:hypothetical protein
MEKFFVIKWNFYDNSAAGVIPYVFSKLSTATRFKEILDVHGTRKYEIEELPVFGEDDGNP